MDLVPVGLSEQEIADYYAGFSNATLWPLYHDVIAPPVFHRQWWRTYQKVNARFAEAAAEHAAEGATVWVHDYQLQLVPALLREARPDLRIGFFNHIPFPGYEIFAQLPWRSEIVEGLLGADLVGFQRQQDVTNFLRAARRAAGRSTQGLQRHGGRGRQPARPGGHLPDQHRRGQPRGARPARRRAGQGEGDPRRARRPPHRAARRRPARLHQGDPAPAQGLRRAAQGAPARSAQHGPGPGRQPQPGARRAVPGAARRGRGHGRPHQRRPQRPRPPGHQLPAPLLPAGRDGCALPGGRRPARHVAARRDEPGRQGVRRLPVRRDRRPWS